MNAPESILRLIVVIAYVACLVHVFVESKRDKRVGAPVRHTLMNALLWPLAYLCWILWWPGSLRQWLLGLDEDRIRERVRRRFAEMRRTAR